MTEEKLVEDILEIASELDRGDIDFKEAKEKAELLVKIDRYEQLLIQRVVSSFVFVLKAKDREEPLGIYKTYQKAYRSKTNFAKMNWTNTYIEKWNIS